MSFPRVRKPGHVSSKTTNVPVFSGGQSDELGGAVHEPGDLELVAPGGMPQDWWSRRCSHQLSRGVTEHQHAGCFVAWNKHDIKRRDEVVTTIESNIENWNITQNCRWNSLSFYSILCKWWLSMLDIPWYSRCSISKWLEMMCFLGHSGIDILGSQTRKLHQTQSNCRSILYIFLF